MRTFESFCLIGEGGEDSIMMKTRLFRGDHVLPVIGTRCSTHPEETAHCSEITPDSHLLDAAVFNFSGKRKFSDSVKNLRLYLLPV